MASSPKPVVTVAEVAMEVAIEEARRKLMRYLPLWETERATGKLGVELDLKDGKPVGKLRVVFTEHVNLEKP